MDGARWDRAKELFQDAVELPAAQRSAWLAARCGDDPGVAEEVRALLAAHEQAAANEPGAAADRIGRYRLLSLLGEGGFGTVHLAEQHEPVHRRVALKVLRPGMDSAQVLARFALEREALARMSHPNIAQIHDAGTTDRGLPFFVMEFVDGASLVPYCDRARLPLGSRLRLFVMVCRGVHHAHQKGVIHRDLKPSNVLVATVDGAPVPKIIDFGIAKALATGEGEGAGASATLEGRCLGTPGYMSPEQADLSGGTVDVRTDVYSLGILLYELLTGRLPHDPGPVQERGLLSYLQRVREVDPARPSTTATSLDPDVAATRGATVQTLRRRLRGDLDWITLKALERDPARRYQSAAELAEDLERHLRHEPVLAGPPGFGYRLRKAVRRHRAVAASSVAILLALVSGLVAALWQNGIARDALRDAIGHRLSAQAINLAEESPTLALLLAIEGAERTPGEDADASLYTALGLHHEVAQALLHDGVPYWAAVSADGTCMLSGDDSLLLVCRDLPAGTVRHRFDLPQHRLLGLAVDRAGHRGASFDEQGDLRLLDLQHGTELAHVALPGPLAGAEFVDGDGTLLTAGADGVLRLCSAAGALTEVAHHPSPLVALRSLPDARSAAVLRADGTVLLHALPGGQVEFEHSLPKPAGELDRDTTADLQFSADGHWLVCLTKRGNLVVVDRQDPTRTWQPTTLPCWTFALAGSAGLLAFCEAHGTLASIDLATRRRIELPSTNRPMVRLVMDPAGHTLVGETFNQPLLRILDPVLGLHLANVRGANHAFYGTSISLDGEWIDALGHNGVAYHWRTSVLGEERRLAQRRARGTLQGGVPIPPGDRALCWNSADGRTRYSLVDVVSGAELAAFGEVARREPSVTLSPRNDAVILDWTDETVVLRLPDGAPLFHCGHHLSRPRCNAALTHLVGLAGARVQAFDLRTGTKVFDHQNLATQYADIDCTGTHVLTADGGRNTTTAWSIADGAPLRTIQHSAFAFDARFTPDGQQFVTFANDTQVRIVDLATGRTIRQLRMPTGDFGWVHLDPEGRFLAVQTPEETCVHELATGQRRLRWAPDDRAEFFEPIAFTADGCHLLANFPDRRYRLLPMDPLAAARQLTPRQLTAGERARYDLPEAPGGEPPVLASRVHIDAALAMLEDGRAPAARVAEALARLDLAAAMRRRPLPRWHLARAVAFARRAELSGGAADLEAAFAEVAEYREAGGEPAVRTVGGYAALAWLRAQPGFGAGGGGRK